MRSRILSALVVASLATVLLAGCGDDSGTATGGDSTKELASTPGSGGSDSNSNSGSDSDSSSDLGSGSDISLPDLDDLEDITGGTMPDFESLGDCMAVGLAYAGLGMSLLGGDDAGANIDEALAEIRQELPEELRDDLEVLGAGYRDAAKDGLMGDGAALETPEFKEADQAVSTWVEEECGG